MLLVNLEWRNRLVWHVIISSKEKSNMKSKRLHKYLQQKSAAKNKPPIDKQDIQNSSDKHIDQDFPGYPHAPSKEEIIKPKTKDQEKTASINTKDGEKIISPANRKKGSPNRKGEQESDGSGNAFEGTEKVQVDE
jgi:hypothetical protein